MSDGLKRIAALVLVPVLLVFCLPTTSWAGDGSSDGTAITVGLFAAVLAVLFIVGLQSDIENVFGRKDDPAREIDTASLARNLELVVENPSGGVGVRQAEGADDLASAQRVGIGFRLDF